MPLALVLGMAHEAIADRYATGDYDPSDKAFDLGDRLGRDAVRVGELLRRGWDVISVNLSVPENRWHANINFKDRDRGERGGSFASAVGSRIPPNRRIDAVMDDWVYLPVGEWARNTYFHPNKWRNIESLAREGLLAPGCRVYISLHADAVPTLVAYGLHKFRAAGLEPVLSPDWNHPLWFSAFDADGLRQLPQYNRMWLLNKMESDLRKNLAPKHSLRAASGLPIPEPKYRFLCLQYKKRRRPCRALSGLRPGNAPRKRRLVHDD